MDFDAWIGSLTPADLLVALLAALTALAYLAVMARAYSRARLLVELAREVRRRRRRQEQLLRARGYAPRLDHYRRLELEMDRKLEQEGLRA